MTTLLLAGDSTQGCRGMLGPRWPPQTWGEGLWGSPCWFLSSCGVLMAGQGFSTCLGCRASVLVVRKAPAHAGASQLPRARQWEGRCFSFWCWGELLCPSPTQEHQAPPAPPWLCLLRAHPAHPGCAPSLCTGEGSRAAGRSPLLTGRIFSMNGQTSG